MKRAVCHLSRRERSDRIVRCDPGEGFRCIDRPYPLTRRCAPTSPHGRGEEQPRRTFLATSKINALTHCFFPGAQATKQSRLALSLDGLLRFARNDVEAPVAAAAVSPHHLPQFRL